MHTVGWADAGEPCVCVCARFRAASPSRPPPLAGEELVGLPARGGVGALPRQLRHTEGHRAWGGETLAPWSEQGITFENIRV